MVRLEITGGHASALDGMQWVVVLAERGRWARGTSLSGDGLGGGEQGLTIAWNTMCRRQRMSQ